MSTFQDKLLARTNCDEAGHFAVPNHGGNTIGTTCVVDRGDTAYMVVDREFRLPTE